MDYLTALADRLRRRCDDPDGDPALYRLYAVLALAKAPHVTDEDVHNAWSAWMAAMRPEHRSLVPFERLAPAVRELDRPYAEAINAVFAQGQPCARCGGSGQLDNRGRPYPPEVAATFGNDGAPCRDCAGTGMCTGGRHAG